MFHAPSVRWARSLRCAKSPRPLAEAPLRRVREFLRPAQWRQTEELGRCLTATLEWTTLYVRIDVDFRQRCLDDRTGELEIAHHRHAQVDYLATVDRLAGGQ